MYNLVSSSRDLDVAGTGRNSLEDLCKCFLGLNDLQYRLFTIILEYPGKTCKELSELAGQTRTPVQRAVKKLHDMEMVTRDQVSRGDPPGFYFTYSPLEPEELREHLLHLVNLARDEMVRIIDDRFPQG